MNYYMFYTKYIYTYNIQFYKYEVSVVGVSLYIYKNNLYMHLIVKFKCCLFIRLEAIRSNYCLKLKKKYY